MARRWQSWAWAALWLLGCDAGDRVRSEPFACQVNEDCVAGFWCDEGRCQPGQPQCAVDPDCPADQVCNNQVCGAIGDGRCRQDSDCPGDKVCDAAGRCAARDAPGCDDARPCPDGQACQGGACVAAWDEVCNGEDDDLDGRVDEGAPAAGLDCPPVGRGACERSREAACIDGAIRCPAVEPGPASDEVCNQQDDDCDGRVDEGLGAPGAAERCDGVDNDCDGQVDEGQGVGEPCFVGDGPCRREGVYVCGDDGRNRCDAEPGQPGDELCNGEDDDCDGETDETFPEQGDRCPVGEGGCEADGVKICVGGALRCDGMPNLPVDEQCDGVDNDCNGVVDDVPTLGNACTLGLGPCTRMGVLVCAGAPNPVCDAVPADGREELCNGEDDDCDGATDEDFQLDLPCGAGVCAGQGIRRCLGNGSGFVCDLVGQQAEACNGLDDDCDGSTDEGLDGGIGQQCDAGEGACRRRGVLACVEGRMVCDAQPGDPAAEECNGQDDDCDGEVDEAIVGAGCTIGAGACLSVGQLACREGMMACNAEVILPDAERCDGLDNDCDGSADEGACGGQACFGNADCPGGLCFQQSCLPVCEGEGEGACCPGAGAACGVREAWCGGPGDALDPCPRVGFRQLSVGLCGGAEGLVCEPTGVVSNGPFDCRGPETDVCDDGACVARPACGPAACAGQPEFFGCSEQADLARCVDGQCMGWASYADSANSRGPVFQVPLASPGRVDRFEQANDEGGVTWQDRATTMSWRAAPGPQPFQALNLADAHRTCLELGGGWRLPTVHDLISLLGGFELLGEHRLVSRTTLFEDAATVDLQFQDEAVAGQHVGGLDGQLKFICVNSVGIDRPGIRVDGNGNDLWVGLQWVPVPGGVQTAEEAEAACRAEAATLARVEELYARLDARPTGGEFRDAVTGLIDRGNYFAFVSGGEPVQVNLSTGRVRRANGAGEVMCVRGAGIQACDDDASCAPGQVCATGRCELP